jgi:hypothetical protein
MERLSIFRKYLEGGGGPGPDIASYGNWLHGLQKVWEEGEGRSKETRTDSYVHK